jgi:hypothetical protein
LGCVGRIDYRLITSSTRTGGTPGDWKPVVIANFLNEWIRRNYNGLVLWEKEGKTFREQINWYDRRPLMEQADIRIFITEQVEALLLAADQQRIAQLRQNFQPPGSQLTTKVIPRTKEHWAELQQILAPTFRDGRRSRGRTEAEAGSTFESSKDRFRQGYNQSAQN